jgi:hypothetical protein
MSTSQYNGVNLAMALALAVGGYYGYKVYPYYRDYFVMKELVQEVALQYKELGIGEARALLSEELDDRGVGLYFVEDYCDFYEKDGWSVVNCRWSVGVPFPFIERKKMLHFEIEEAADRRGLAR